jgi:hypothetical protein
LNDPTAAELAKLLSFSYDRELLMLLNALFTDFAIPLIEVISAIEIRVNNKAYSTRSWPSSPWKRVESFTQAL